MIRHGAIRRAYLRDCNAPRSRPLPIWSVPHYTADDRPKSDGLRTDDCCPATCAVRPGRVRAAALGQVNASADAADRFVESVGRWNRVWIDYATRRRAVTSDCLPISRGFDSARAPAPVDSNVRMNLRARPTISGRVTSGALKVPLSVIDDSLDAFMSHWLATEKSPQRQLQRLISRLRMPSRLTRRTNKTCHRKRKMWIWAYGAQILLKNYRLK